LPNLVYQDSDGLSGGQFFEDYFDQSELDLVEKEGNRAAIFRGDRDVDRTVNREVPVPEIGKAAVDVFIAFPHPCLVLSLNPLRIDDHFDAIKGN
jgi:hypothetical protein